MTHPTKAPATRERLIATALAILKEGKEVLTMDAVVKRSGISKGGLVHHFPTKEALLEAAVEESIRLFSETAGQASVPMDNGSPEEARAYVDGGLAPATRKAAAEVARGMFRCFGSDFREHTPVLDPWRRLFASRLDGFRERGDPKAFAKAAILTLVVESFVMVDGMGLYDFTEAEIAAIKQALID